MIDQAVSQNLWKGIKVSRTGPMISHLFFVDDLVLFGEATEDQMQVIMTCLERFCGCSSQRINFQKSQLYCSSNVSDLQAMYLSNLAGIPLTNDLGRYLGVPSIHGRVCASSFEAVLDRLRGRLEGWRSRYLSFAGRHVLEQSVLSAIPLYIMQTFLLPKGFCNKLEKIIRAFLWGGDSENRKINLVAWEKVTKKKEFGGLGIRSMHEMNLAFLAKLGWRLVYDDASLWVRMFGSKYMSSNLSIDNIVPKQKASNA